jgi:hypothetical protein
VRGADGSEATRYFIDLELGIGKPSGLDIIQRLGIAGRSTLVTGALLSRGLIERCVRHRVRILPKRLFDDLAPLRRADAQGLARPRA